MGEWEIIVEDGDLVVEFEKSGENQKKKGKAEKTEKQSGGLLLQPPVLKSMEIRAQSIFRPGQKDIEIVYALSGDGYKIDMLHQFSTEDVLYGSSSIEANVNIENMIAHIKAETGEVPELLVIVHTHPEGTPFPSPQDKLFFRSTAQTIKQYSPGTEVFYGIHAISGGSVRAKKDYEKVNENTVKWSSITHDHEVAFYTEESKPKEVNLNG